MDEDRTNKPPLEFIDSKTVMLSLDEDFQEYLENRPQQAAVAAPDQGLDMEAEQRLVDISMALHQLMGLKAN